MNDEVAKLIETARVNVVSGCDREAILALSTAVQILNDPRVFRHDWTPEELAQQERLKTEPEPPLPMYAPHGGYPPSIDHIAKPLTLDDLKRQVDKWHSTHFEWSMSEGMTPPSKIPFPDGYPLHIGDFEIRRRK